MTGYDGLADGQWYQASDGNWYCWPDPTPYPAPQLPPATQQPVVTPDNAGRSWRSVLVAGLALAVLATGGTAYAVRRQDVRARQGDDRRIAAIRAAAEAKVAEEKRAAEVKAAADAARLKGIEPYLAVVEPELAQALKPLNAWFEQDDVRSDLAMRLRLVVLKDVLATTPAPAEVAAEAAALRSAVAELSSKLEAVYAKAGGGLRPYNIAIADAAKALGPFFTAVRGLYAKAGRSPSASIRRYLPL